MTLKSILEFARKFKTRRLSGKRNSCSRAIRELRGANSLKKISKTEKKCSRRRLMKKWLKETL